MGNTITMFVPIVIAVVLAVLFYQYGYKPTKYWQEQGVVHEPAYPFVGSMLALLTRKKHICQITMDQYQKYPNERFLGIMQFSQPILMIRDVDLLKAITVKEFDHFQNRTSIAPTADDPIFSKSLVALQGEKWRQMRATLSPAFTSSKMRIMYTLISECAQNFVEHFKGKEQVAVEMKNLSTRFMNDVIATTAFGITVNSVEDPDNEFFKLGTSLLKMGPAQMFRALLFTIAPGLAKILRMRIFPESLINFFKNVVHDNISKREAQNIIRPDMIQLMMDAKKGQLKHEQEPVEKDVGFATVEESHIGRNTKQMELTDEHIVAQALLFFFAGFETTSTAACFLAHELAVNPDVQKKLQDEIDQELRKHENISYEVLLSMKYLDQVVSESLRMWPPGFQGDRVCAKDFVIEPIQKGEKSYIIREGTSVMLPFMAIHRDAKYFPDPDRFDPERFSEENKRNIVPGSYMPFGAGPRNCIASRFALLELKTLFFHILANFELVVIDKTVVPMKINPKSLVMAPKNGFNLALKPRQKS